MATPNSMYVDPMEIPWNCPICLDTLKEASDLACGHTYCLECVLKLEAIRDWTSNIKCCPCHNKTSIPSTGLNWKLTGLIEEQAAITKKTPRQQQGTTVERNTLKIWLRDEDDKITALKGFNVRLSDPLDFLKRQVENEFHILLSELILLFGGRPLTMEGSTTLKDCGIREDSVIGYRHDPRQQQETISIVRMI